MPRPIGLVSAKLLTLKVGQSHFVNLRRPDQAIRVAKKHAPAEAAWTVESVDGGKIVTRTR